MPTAAAHQERSRLALEKKQAADASCSDVFGQLLQPHLISCSTRSQVGSISSAPGARNCTDHVQWLTAAWIW